MKLKLFFSVCLLIIASFFISCRDKIMGYSVVLWNIPEQQLSAGQIVPVYIKSNISSVYVVGFSDDKKFEVQLWQLTAPVPKKKAIEEAKKYEDYAHTYASVKLDGLPIRAETLNTSKQVYRLRQGETIKILYKGKGHPVMAGQTALEGDWLRVLTTDGTQGWCFSYNLSLYELNVDGERADGLKLVQEETKDTIMENSVLDFIWYPDYFKTIIDSGNIDLSRLNVSYRFLIDTENSKVTLNINDIKESWDYDGYTKSNKNEYVLNNIPIIVFYKNRDSIVLRYTNSSGKPQDLSLARISQNINLVVAQERERRNSIYQNIYKQGPKFKSSTFGTLTLENDGTFTWVQFNKLVPEIISSSAKNTGTVSIKYGVSKSVRENYDGVITFNFDGMNKEVNFLYKIENGGLRLEDASRATFKSNTITSRASGAMIIYFNVSS